VDVKWVHSGYESGYESVFTTNWSDCVIDGIRA
jgi:hypothetical protein